MASILKGKRLNVSIFGQSHSKAIGCVIDGLPSGVKLDNFTIQQFMARRAPGKNAYSTARKEADMPIVLSGLVDNTTCGAPLAVMIENTNAHPQDYDALKNTPRPGHSDFTASVKYNAFNDVSGGGHFSGRLTAPLCYAGAVCMQILKAKGIEIKAHIRSIYDVEDEAFCPTAIQPVDIAKKDFPVLDDVAGERMQKAIQTAVRNGDSVGGVIECAVTGVPVGLGEPMFDGIENNLSKNIFAIPAVKGIEFGSGFESTKMYGSQNNDDFTHDENGNIVTTTNHHGGILGGISSGMPILFRVAIKPTPSIAQPQHSVDLKTGEDTVIVVKGRHDPCIVPRAVPIVEAVAAITILDFLL